MTQAVFDRFGLRLGVLLGTSRFSLGVLGDSHGPVNARIAPAGLCLRTLRVHLAQGIIARTSRKGTRGLAAHPEHRLEQWEEESR